MKTEFIEEEVFIVTENADGVLYTIESSIKEIFDDWYGDCNVVPANDAKVYFATYHGVPISPAFFEDFLSLLTYLK